MLKGVNHHIIVNKSPASQITFRNSSKEIDVVPDEINTVLLIRIFCECFCPLDGQTMTLNSIKQANSQGVMDHLQVYISSSRIIHYFD